MTKQHLITLKAKSLNTLSNITVRLHRTRVANGITYNELKSLVKLDKKSHLHVQDNNNINAMPFRKVVLWRFDKNDIKTYLGPICQSRYMVSTITEFRYPSKLFLQRLNQLIPNLNVVSAEYAIDLFCNGPKDVEKLMFIIRRYLYIPYFPSKNHTMIIGCDGYVDWFQKREENAVYRVGKFWKVYERGPDELRQWDDKKKSPYWRYKDLDRVRIEFTAKNYYLHKFKIKQLSQFLKNPRFKEMLLRFQFKTFKRTQGLPGEFDEYTATDMYGNKDSYMEEYIKARKMGIKNRYQYSINPKNARSLNYRN